MKTEKKNTGTIAFRFRQVLLYNCAEVNELMATALKFVVINLFRN